MSVVVHGHVLLAQQWAAVGIVFAGLALEVVTSQLEKRKSRHRAGQHHHDAAAPAADAAEGKAKAT